MTAIRLLLIVFVLSFSFCEGQSWLWGRQSKGIIGEWGQGYACSGDRTGNVYIIGWFEDTLSFGPFILSNNNNGTECFIAKYDKNGNLLWAESSHGNLSVVHDCWGYAVTTDNQNNVYLAGSFTDSCYFGTIKLSSVGLNAFVVKYDSNGNVIWAKQSTLSNNGEASGVATDNDRNVYLTGGYQDSIWFGSTKLAGNYNWNRFLVKYNSAGNIVWINAPFSYSYESYSNAVNVDAKNTINIIGGFKDTLDFGIIKLISDSGINFFVAKFDTSGKILWANQSKGSLDNNIGAGAISSDINGNVVITAYFIDSIHFNSTELYSSNTSSEFGFLVKYDATGTLLWAKTGITVYNKAGFNGSSVACDDTDNIYLAGGFGGFDYFLNDTLKFGNYSMSLTDSTLYGEDFSYIVKFDSSGNAKCGAMFLGGTPSVSVNQNSFEIYVGGSNQGYGLFASDTLQNIRTVYAYVARWFGCGTPLSVHQIEQSLGSISLFPNPNSGKFTIQTSNQQLMANSSVEIYNVLGEKVYSSNYPQSTNRYLLNLSSNPNGVYLYRVISVNGTIAGEGKFVIQK